ncbi:hypothetical protein KIN20_036521 [Parelaphostrongylus tenuis]|uniref:Uncharacterized protein n=1 Tax=Parelaphostrongylus tenuis TaxID=148309 RepID=A0AAD5RCY2_PARTN|nr:hypothetical protein KIN20_036521 [Parelaphostrongylus tenuis]
METDHLKVIKEHLNDRTILWRGTFIDKWFNALAITENINCDYESEFKCRNLF